jgi:recombination protein RecT
MTDTQTVGQAVAEVSVPKMISPELFEQVLPAQVGAAKFTRWALTLLRHDDLAAVARTPAGQLSIVTALLDCASLGLEPGRTYHLVPFGGKVEGITDYKGEIQLITNANPHASVIAQLVRKNDDFHMTGANIPPKHDADWFDEDARGPVTGGYSYVDYGERYSLVVRMSERKFLQHRAKAKTKNVWDEWPEEMRFKTLIHQLRKTEPWSAEARRS